MTALQEIWSEMVVWSQLQHKNVLPLLGTCTYKGKLSFVVPWMQHGTALDYMRENPEADRLSIVCLLLASRRSTYSDELRRLSK